ncbi:MAG: PilZ domain-containing protein [Acidobacteria bacterium]|nr:PilZ domain-containing protein [Acidobacteriota bacterium]
MIETTKQNRRKELRHKKELPLRIQGDDSLGKFFVEITLTNNISLSGACISLNHELKIGQQLQIFTCGNLIPNQTSGKVCWLRRQRDSWLVGLHFERSNKFWKNVGDIFNQLLSNQNHLHPFYYC